MSQGSGDCTTCCLLAVGVVAAVAPEGLESNIGALIISRKFWGP